MSLKRRLAIFVVAWVVVPWTWAIAAERLGRRGGGGAGSEG